MRLQETKADKMLLRNFKVKFPNWTLCFKVNNKWSLQVICWSWLIKIPPDLHDSVHHWQTICFLSLQSTNFCSFYPTVDILTVTFINRQNAFKTVCFFICYLNLKLKWMILYKFPYITLSVITLQKNYFTRYVNNILTILTLLFKNERWRRGLSCVSSIAMKNNKTTDCTEVIITTRWSVLIMFFIPKKEKI